VLRCVQSTGNPLLTATAASKHGMHEEAQRKPLLPSSDYESHLNASLQQTPILSVQSALLQRNTALEQHIATAQQQPQALPQQSMSTPSSVAPPPIPSPTPPPPLKQEPHSSPEQSSECMRE